MGLDSVELLMENENFFNIRIPDREAEQIYTVQNLVDTIAKHLNIVSDDRKLQDTVFLVLTNNLRQQKNIYTDINFSDKISKYLSPEEPQLFLNLTNEIILKTPKITGYNKTDSNIFDKFKKLISWKPSYDWEEITVEDFVNSICAFNYKSLIKQQNINSKYEIYIGVVGITGDKIGVDYFEIKPEKSFTNDLGVD